MRFVGQIPRVAILGRLNSRLVFLFEIAMQNFAVQEQLQKTLLLDVVSNIKKISKLTLYKAFCFCW